MRRPLQLYLLLLFQLIITSVNSQVKITGYVYDSSGVFPLEATSVLSNSGTGMMTDSNGHYEIWVSEKDSIWFSYLGKPTIKYPVAEIKEYLEFDISLRVGVTILKEVRVRPASYKLDSIRNRMDYAKVFNYRKPSFSSIVTSISITGITIDLDELIRAFQKRKMERMLVFRKRLEEQEKDKLIDHRFTRSLVSTITGLAAERLDRFMLTHRPSYDFVKQASDYDLRDFIKKEFKKFK